jgi:hypothetical protein
LSAIVWRLRPLGVPSWPERCTRCLHPELVSTGAFRVNANGARHDVWLVYRCPACQAGRRRRVLRRVAEGEAGVPLDRYRHSDPALAVAHAFAFPGGPPVAYAVVRPPLAADGGVSARIEQPLFCGARWDRFLARELSWSRTQAARALCDGRARVWPHTRPDRPVRDGDRLEVAPGAIGDPVS